MIFVFVFVLDDSIQSKTEPESVGNTNKMLPVFFGLSITCCLILWLHLNVTNKTTTYKNQNNNKTTSINNNNY